jgi:nucleoside-diphosphate-sugar epimerase
MKYDQINKWGTLNLVRCIQNTGNSVKKFIYLSSISIYGLNENVDFNDEPIPSNAYGKSKFAAEKYVKALKDKMNVEIV